MSNNFSYGYKNFSIDPIAQEVINMIPKDPKKDMQSSEQLFQIFKNEFSSKYSRLPFHFHNDGLFGQYIVNIFNVIQKDNLFKLKQEPKQGDQIEEMNSTQNSSQFFTSQPKTEEENYMKEEQIQNTSKQHKKETKKETKKDIKKETKKEAKKEIGKINLIFDDEGNRLNIAFDPETTVKEALQEFVKRFKKNYNIESFDFQAAGSRLNKNSEDKVGNKFMNNSYIGVLEVQGLIAG